MVPHTPRTRRQADAGSEAGIPIAVRFTVLADGAAPAVRTWRFEALPETMGETTQTGTVIFNFKLDKSTPDRQ